MPLDSHRCVLGHWRFCDFARPASSWIASIKRDVQRAGDTTWLLKTFLFLFHQTACWQQALLPSACLFPPVIHQTWLDLLARPYQLQLNQHMTQSIMNTMQCCSGHSQLSVFSTVRTYSDVSAASSVLQTYKTVG